MRWVTGWRVSLPKLPSQIQSQKPHSGRRSDFTKLYTLSLNKLKDLLFKTHSAKSVPLREFEGRPPTRKKIFPTTVDQGQPQTETKAAKQNNPSETAEKTWRVPEHKRRSVSGQSRTKRRYAEREIRISKAPPGHQGCAKEDHKHPSERRNSQTLQAKGGSGPGALRAALAGAPRSWVVFKNVFVCVCLCVEVRGLQETALSLHRVGPGD